MKWEDKRFDLTYEVEETTITDFLFRQNGFVLVGRYAGYSTDGVRDVYSIDLYDNGVRVFSQSPLGLSHSERNKPSALLEAAMAIFCIGPEEEEFARDESPEQIEWRESSRRNDLDVIRQTIVEDYNLA